MYDLELYFKIYFVVSLIVWIVFFKMAINIGKVREAVSKQVPDRKSIAELALFKGQKEKAIDALMDLLFEQVYSGSTNIEKNQEDVHETIKKIESLGGKIPNETRKEIKNLMGV